MTEGSTDRIALIAKLIDELVEVFHECKDRDWDGYDAMPIQQASFDTVASFVAAMPTDIVNIVVNAERSGGFLSHIQYLVNHAESFTKKAKAIAEEVEKMREPKDREGKKTDNRTFF